MPSDVGRGAVNLALPSGALIEGQYRVVRPLGVGGMGIVMLARDERLARDVAIKLVRPELLSLADARATFLTEARAMARLVHPNVVGVHAVGELSTIPYIVMEYVPGRALEALLADRGGGPLGVDEAFGVLDQVCRGVSAMHTAGIIHRDLKPANVLVGPAFRVAVADLGIARLVAELREEDDGTVSGTPAYMAPEVRLGAPAAPSLAARADVFSLGVLAYQLLTGRLPYLHAKIPGVGKPPSASGLNPCLPAEIDSVLEGALEFLPQERTESVDVFRRALMRVIHELGSSRPALSRIIVVDDDPYYRDLTRMVLSRGFPGAEIEGVDDGVAALEAVERAAPDLLVSDLDMPRLDGLGLTTALRELPGGRDFPTIISTAVGGPTDWRLLSRLDADGFLGKPFDPTQLVALARAVLDTHARGGARIAHPGA